MNKNKKRQRHTKNIHTEKRHTHKSNDTATIRNIQMRCYRRLLFLLIYLHEKLENKWKEKEISIVDCIV